MPKQGGIQDSMNRFLAQYLPMLFQQQQREGFTEFSNQAYLERYLKQLEAQEGVAGRGRQDALQKDFVLQMIKSLFSETEDLPYSSGQLAARSAPTAEAFGLQPLPTDPDLGSKTQRFAQVGQELATAKATGATPSDELLQEAIGMFGLEAVREEVAAYSDAAAKRIDQIARQEEIGIKRGSAETARFSAITRAGEPAIEAAATQKKDWLAFVTDIEDFLRGEGITGGTLSQRIKGLFSTGKILDPLSSENRGAAFTYLGQIRAKLIQGKALTDGDIRFLTTVRNTSEIEGSVSEGREGRGLTDPTVSDEEAAVNEATIQAHMDAIREATGETDETKLRALAIEFLKVIK